MCWRYTNSTPTTLVAMWWMVVGSVIAEVGVCFGWWLRGRVQ